MNDRFSEESSHENESDNKEAIFLRERRLMIRAIPFYEILLDHEFVNTFRFSKLKIPILQDALGIGEFLVLENREKVEGRPSFFSYIDCRFLPGVM